MDDTNEKLELIALELIRRAISDLPSAIARNITATSSASSTGSGSGSGLADAMRKAAEGTALNPYELPPPPPPPPTLRQRVASAAQSAAAFTRDNQITRSATAQGGMKALDTAAGTLATRFGAMFGPLQMVNQVVSAQSSGFGVLGSATKLLAATIGPVLLPVTISFAATVARMSDVLWSRLLPNLDKWDRLVMGQLVPAGEGLVGLFGKLGDTIEWLNKKAGGEKTKEEETTALGSISKLDKGLDKFLAGERTEGLKDIAAASWASIKGVVDPLGVATGAARRVDGVFGSEEKDKPAGGVKDFAGAMLAGGAAGATPGAKGAVGAGAKDTGMAGSMREALRELRLSVGPKASISNLSDVGRNAQLAFLQQSPWEAKLVERLDTVIRIIEHAAEPGGPSPLYGKKDPS